MRVIVLLLVLIAPAAAARAAIYTDVMPGARPMGMGMAFASVSDDPYALFYNPAGLAGSNDYQLGGSFGRMFSPVGPLSFLAAVNTRPFPWRPNGVMGAGFFSLRQTNGGSKDEVLAHYSEPVRYSDLASLWPYLPDLAFLRPIKLGANFKIIKVAYQGVGKLAIGTDAGFQVDSGSGLKAGASVTDLTSDVRVPQASLNAGASYELNRWLLLASDFRVRPGLAQFFPGVEASIFEGLLKARVGKGLPLDGVGQVAFGFGADFSPVFLDFAMTMPWAGINRPGGASQITLNYKFGAPSFYGRFVGAAARRAEELNTQVLDLESRKKALESQAGAAQAGFEANREQARALETRLKNLQAQIMALERKVAEKSYESVRPPPHAPLATVGAAAPAAASAKPKGQARVFPRQHAVAPGDTLRSLAGRYYGDPNLWEVIYDANRDKVERGLPQEGAVLTIPGPPPSAREEAR